MYLSSASHHLKEVLFLFHCLTFFLHLLFPIRTEYEGSPRRIGQCIIEEDDKIECITSPDRRNYKLYHTSVTTPRLDSSPPAVHLPLSARPGFPQVTLMYFFFYTYFRFRERELFILNGSCLIIV